MLKRKILILAIILVSLLSVSLVSANDNTTLDTTGISDNDDEILTIDENQVTATDGESSGNFSELSELVQNTTEGDTLNLTKNFKSTEDSKETVVINKTMTIDGQNHIIDANYLSQIFFINATQVTLKNIKFVNVNYDGQGGAIYLAPDSSLSIYDSRFIDCYAQFGGAIYADENSNLTIEDSNFTQCAAESGGAIYFATGSTSSITGSNFNNDVADVIGGGFLASGGNDITLFETNFINCSAAHESGGAFAIVWSNLNAQYMQVINCSSIFGGAITILSTNSTISHSTFRKNSATYDGGAIFAMYELFSLDDNNFTDNSARKGGALYISQTNNTIVNNQFEDNTASLGAAIYAMTCNDNLVENNPGLTPDNYYKTVNDNLTITSIDFNSFTLNETSYSVLPAVYSLLDDYVLSPVKDQGTEGNCWAFAAMAVLESCIIKSANVTFDLSEANLKNLMAMYSDYGYRVLTNDGGFPDMVCGYLASWLGPIYDEDDFYSINDYLSPLLSNVLHVQNIVFIKRENTSDNDAIKEAILRYGAVGTSMHYDNDYLNSFSYYYDGNESTDHAVVIVGWDDTYSKDNFKNTPEDDGAWIVRNSWGPSWGNNGYFYVSYYDSKFAEVNGTSYEYTFILNDTVKLNRVYQYEIEHTSRITNNQSNEALYKNIFTVEGDEMLAAVSTYFLDSCNYNVTVYINDNYETSKAGKADMGYYTIYLDNRISLNKNDNVTVEFHCTDFKNGKSLIPCSVKSLNTNLFIKEGVSYYFSGNKWVDFYKTDAVACIKMFTTFSNPGKSTPYFQVNSQKDVSENSYLITFTLPPDATGFISIDINGNVEKINISTTRSIKLYDLDENNNTLLLSYSGDESYFERNTTYVVDLNSDKANFNDLFKKVNGLKDGDVLSLDEDYYYFSGSTSGIDIICSSVTIDGKGHVIDANGQSVIFNIFANNVILKNIKFVGANNGDWRGAIYLGGSNCSIINCSFINNIAADNGGAIYLVGTNCSLINCSLVNNSAKFGGAICLVGNLTKLIDCSFVNNSALNASGAIYVIGSDIVAYACSFVNNSALNVAGVMYISSDGMIMSNCSFVNNSAYNGGAIYLSSDDMILGNCSFVNNSASKDGGAIYIQGDDVTLENCSFVNNSALRYGGAICSSGNWTILTNNCFVNNSAETGGAVIWFADNTGFVDNCSFINNSADNGGAIYIQRNNVTLENCSFVNNSADNGGAIYIQRNNVTLDYCSFVNNSASNYGGAVYWHGVDGLMNSCSFVNNSASNYGAAVLWYGNNGTITNSTFSNNLGSYQLFWNPQSGIINGCYYLNSSGNNVYKGGATIIKNYINLVCNNTTFGYKNPETLSLYVNNPYTPKLTFRLSNGYTVTTDDISVVYGELATLDRGNWTLQVSFKEDDTYYAFDETFTLNVVPAASSLNLSVGNITLGHESTLKATVLDPNYSKINEGIVIFSDGGETIGTVNVENGVATLKYTPKTSGEHLIKAVFSSDNYADSNSSETLFVDDVTVKISVEPGMVGINSTFSVNVTALYGIVSDGTVSFYIENQYIGKSALAGGIASLSYAPSIAGDLTLKAVYAESQIFSCKEESVLFNVSKAPSSTVLNQVNGTVGREMTLNVDVTSPNGIINDGTVTFMDGDEVIGTADVENGVATLKYTPKVGGERQITAKYSGNNYEDSNGTAKSYVDGVIIEISQGSGVVGFNSTFAANVTAFYSDVKDGSLSFYLGGVFMGKRSLVDGKANLTYAPLTAGNLTLLVVYDESQAFSKTESSIYYWVEYADSNVTIDSITGVVGSDLTLTAHVSSSNGLIINEGGVYFIDEIMDLGFADVVGGIATMPYVPLWSGNHTITARFYSSNYRYTESDIKIFIDKAETQMAFSALPDVYYDTAATIGIDVSANGKPVSSGTVKVYVNGQEIGEINVTDGHVDFEYKPVSLDELNISAIYGENFNYRPSNASKVIPVNKLATSLTASDISEVYNDGKYLTVVLKDNNGNALKGQKISIDLNGVKHLTTDANGEVKLPTAGLKPKTYSVAITFAGNDFYLKSAKTVKVVIKKANPKLTAAKKTFKRKVKVKKYTITLKNNKNKAMAKVKVTIKVNRKTFTAKTNGKGKATFKIKKLTKKGKYTATVTFKGDACYNKVVKKAKITVK